MSSADRALRALARSYGVQLSYRDGLGRVRRASTDALVAVTRALGAPVGSVSEAPAARERHDRGEGFLPVVVAWDGSATQLPSSEATTHWRLQLEDGTQREWTTRVGEPVDIGPLPLGYHDLESTDGRRTRVIAAPRAAPAPRDRLWGTFLPLYALRAQRGMGIADLTDLEALLRWTDKLGASFVATLPLYAAFLDGADERFDPSPYAPVSRLFYNELHVDPERTPEFEHCPQARELVASSGFRATVEELRRAPTVDHARVYGLKRRVLGLLAEVADRDDARIRAFVDREPLAAAYARFRAGLESDGDGPARARAERYHIYAQLAVHEQLAAVAATEADGGLQLDLPLGVHAEGFDVSAFADAFAPGVTVGAPPDDFNAGGQNWGFPPLHPSRSRATGHRYFSAVIAKAMRVAAVLRVDHVLGLHRQYWIPDGMAADEGVYVRYPAEEIYAVLALEAQRHDTTVVGEDLGTVPRGVRSSMRRHGVLSTYVLQFVTHDDADSPIERPERSALACVNTHDMEPFTAFWQGMDEVRRRAIVSFLRKGEPPPPNSDADASAAFSVLASWLARSEALLVLINLEDLWGETQPQNVPGTAQHERPNWSRKAGLTFEEFTAEPMVVDTLADVARLRERRRHAE